MVIGANVLLPMPKGTHRPTRQGTKMSVVRNQQIQMAADETVSDFFRIREVLFSMEKRQMRGMASENIDTVAALLVSEVVRRAELETTA